MRIYLENWVEALTSFFYVKACCFTFPSKVGPKNQSRKENVEEKIPSNVEVILCIFNEILLNSNFVKGRKCAIRSNSVNLMDRV
jgi:hypothetical protein